MATARAAAQQARGQAAVAVAGLQDLGVPAAEIVEITGLGAREVRDLLTLLTAPQAGGVPVEPDTTDPESADAANGEDGGVDDGQVTPAPSAGDLHPD